MLEKFGGILTGRQFYSSGLFHFLQTGVTFFIFKQEGNLYVSHDLLSFLKRISEKILEFFLIFLIFKVTRRFFITISDLQLTIQEDHNIQTYSLFFLVVLAAQNSKKSLFVTSNLQKLGIFCIFFKSCTYQTYVCQPVCQIAYLTYSRVNVTCVLTCSRANVPCVLMCSRASVPCVLKGSRAYVPCVLTRSRVYVPYGLTCSRTNVPCVLTCSRAITTNGKDKFPITCFPYIFVIVLCLFFVK